MRGVPKGDETFETRAEKSEEKNAIYKLYELHPHAQEGYHTPLWSCRGCEKM